MINVVIKRVINDLQVPLTIRTVLVYFSVNFDAQYTYCIIFIFS